MINNDFTGAKEELKFRVFSTDLIYPLYSVPIGTFVPRCPLHFRA
jgi:hypothetical protein